MDRSPLAAASGALVCYLAGCSSLPKCAPCSCHCECIADKAGGGGEGVDGSYRGIGALVILLGLSLLANYWFVRLHWPANGAREVLADSTGEDRAAEALADLAQRQIALVRAKRASQ